MIRRSGQYEIGYITHQGNVRSCNQDSLLIRRGSIGTHEFLLLAVADGMGGLAHGAEASALAVQALDQWWSRQLPYLITAELDWAALGESLTAEIEHIHRDLCGRNQYRSEESGTTLSLIFVFRDQYRFFQIGDSRIYAFTQHGAIQLTRDQTWCQNEIDAGRLTQMEACVHPNRHALTSALGASEEYTVECRQGMITSGSGILLCTDGFYQELPANWFSAWHKKAEVQKFLDWLAADILCGTASDNLTAILLKTNARRR